ncbi:hypothetical protein CVD28_03255 [Bacillus sp. M6-12]|uniref:type I restriction endonuclease n=1 Tax=Bacillus sp. M6-12 TaxID=2054166 RepID=UPI000C77AE0A|nr:type I restriction endonuclease [Bacillus sp. M6-12]PLS19447.1 hypothetical protein CVD28_03255 [Bacillus sp. M6-12]
MAFKKADFEKLSQKAKYFDELGAVFDEENTKNCFVMPFFLALGYDVFNPLEFMAELNLDTRHNGAEKVDYAICVDMTPRIIIEVKKKGTALKKSIGQLKRYFNSDVRVRYGVLTNGIDYYFFTDTVNQNIMDDHPHYMLNILQLKKDDIEFLKQLTRENVWTVFSQNREGQK